MCLPEGWLVVDQAAQVNSMSKCSALLPSMLSSLVLRTLGVLRTLSACVLSVKSDRSEPHYERDHHRSSAVIHTATA
jgi:hypothetical protein